VLADHVLGPAADAFLEVGTFVAVMLAVFGLLQWRTGGAATRWLERHRRLGPLAGAILGAVPGCGGAIVVMPLYLRGTVSFGTVVATLVATMGDSSFVLIAAAPRTALALHGGLLLAGLLTGAVVDRLGIDPRPGGSSAVDDAPPRVDASRAPRDGATRVPDGSFAGSFAGASTVGAAAAPLGLTGRPVLRVVPPSLLAFWALVLVAFAVAVPTVFQVVDDAAFDLGRLPTRDVLGVAGAAVCLGVAALRWARLRDSHRSCAVAERPREVLFDAGRETAVVTTWVVVAFVGYELLVATTGLDVGRMPTLGLVGVLAGALLGLLPGCGPQLVLTGLYAQGAVPLSVLVANALSQDGDALFPLLAGDRRSAIVGTVLSTIPGLVVGGILVALGR
jgi:hypothetical protein